jgi:lysophospholipase L1-like esterase
MPRYLPFRIESVKDDVPDAPQTSVIGQSEEALTWLLAQARSRGVTPLVIHHKMNDETSTQPPDDWRGAASAKLRAVAGDTGADYLDFGAITHQGQTRETAYRDYIHLTIEGQALLAETMLTWLRPRLAHLAASLPSECQAAGRAAR